MLFLGGCSKLPATLEEFWREILLLERVGVTGVEKVVVTPDGKAYAYSHVQFRSDLHLV